MSIATTHIDNKPSLQASHCEDEERSKRKQSYPLVPALRFSGFDGDWEKKKLGEVAKVTSGGTPSRNNSEFWDGDVPWITTSLIDFNVILHSEEYITKEAVSKSSAKLFPKGTLLMAMYGQGKTRGKIAILGIDATTNQACGAILPSEVINVDFLYQNLAGRYNEIRDLSNDGGQQNLSGGIIKGIEFPLPTPPEQQKIASFLSAVDEKIQQLTKKKALLEQYKKGVMQQLFSGQLRFKDENGNDYPDWEDTLLGDCLKYFQPTKYLVSSTEYDDSFETPVLTAGKTFVLGYTNEKENICNDIPLIIFDDFTTASKYVDFPFKAKSSAMKLLLAKEGVDVKFMFEAMQNIRFEVGGHGRHWISIFSQLVISVPCIEEQQKIATYLSSIDTKIESVNNQIIQTQTFKKGLLQQLFV